MLLREILHYSIFCFYVKITKNEIFFISSSVNSNRFVKYQRKYLFSWNGVLQIDATNHFSFFLSFFFFFLRFISKGIICSMGWLLQSLWYGPTQLDIEDVRVSWGSNKLSKNYREKAWKSGEQLCSLAQTNYEP